MFPEKKLEKKQFRDPHESMVLNPLTLGFTGEQAHFERMYLNFSAQQVLKANRAALVASIAAYSLFGILDAFLVPRLKCFFWILRFAVYDTLALFLLALSLTSWYRKIQQILFMTLEVLAGSIIIVMIITAPPPVNYSYYAGLILVFMMAYTVTRMRFIMASLGGVIIVLFYEIAAITTGTPLTVLINNNFFFIGANIIGMIASYGIERSDRRNFFLNYLLNKEKEKVMNANDVLEEKVLERTAQLRNEINTRKAAQQKLSDLLKEKDTLLKEVYHRTKNNMQIIASLISLETSKTDNPDAKRIFKNTELKIQSMAMVHEGLYESGDLSKINFKHYLENLVPVMIESYASLSTVSLVLELEDVFITIDSAIPCGLIISELIINTLKHAFRETGKGTITVRLSFTADENILLFFSDDGAGVEKNFDFRKQGSMGMETIFALGEHQLHGSVEMNGEGGVSCTLKFKDTALL